MIHANDNYTPAEHSTIARVQSIGNEIWAKYETVLEEILDDIIAGKHKDLTVADYQDIIRGKMQGAE